MCTKVGHCLCKRGALPPEYESYLIWASGPFAFATTKPSSTHQIYAIEPHSPVPRFQSASCTHRSRE